MGEDIHFDTRATKTLELYADLVEAVINIIDDGEPVDLELTHEALAKARGLAHYLYTAPGIDEAARTLYIAVLAHARECYLSPLEVVEVPCDHPCAPLRERCHIVIDGEGRIWDDDGLNEDDLEEDT
jgi:hypothetical protein